MTHTKTKIISQFGYESALDEFRKTLESVEETYAETLLQATVMKAKLNEACTYNYEESTVECPLCEYNGNTLTEKCSFHTAFDDLRERYYELQRQKTALEAANKGDNKNTWIIKLEREQRDWLLWLLQAVVGANKVEPFHLVNQDCANQIWSMLQQEAWGYDGEIGPRNQMSYAELAAKVEKWMGEKWSDLHAERIALRTSVERIPLLERTIGMHRIQIDALRNGRFDVVEQKMREQAETIDRLTRENERLKSMDLEAKVAEQEAELNRLRGDLEAQEKPLVSQVLSQEQVDAEAYLTQLIADDPEESEDQEQAILGMVALFNQPWVDAEIRQLVASTAFYFMRGRHRLRCMNDGRRRLAEMTEFAEIAVASFKSLADFFAQPISQSPQVALNYQGDVLKTYLELYKMDQAPRTEACSAEEEL